MTERVFNVLFLCTGNSARSILGEAILNRDGAGRFRAFSAGSHPTGTVNPHAIELLHQRGFEVGRLRSKSWDEFAGQGAPDLDFVFTVCDSAAGEVCPLWPGQPMTAHWGLADPAAVSGSDEERRNAFLETYAQIARRISLFIALPLAKLDRPSLQARLREIGRLPGQGL